MDIVHELRKELLEKYTEEELYKYGMRDVEGFDKYAITSCGKVWSYRLNRFLSPKPDKDGYLQIGLYNEEGKQKWIFVSRLMALTYLDNPDNLSDASHKDECRTHNWLGNLEWASRLDNNNMPLRKQRISQSVCKKCKCVETGVIYKSRKEASEQTGICYSSIIRACKNERDTAGGFHWTMV